MVSRMLQECFWSNADGKLQKIGAYPNHILWADACGMYSTKTVKFVDDFVFGGNKNDPCWLTFRKNLKWLYRWSPWQKGSFEFSGCTLTQTISQENFGNSLSPVNITGEKHRSQDHALNAAEVSQCGAFLMKAQWRALQSAPQFCARINLASSEATKPYTRFVARGK